MNKERTELNKGNVIEIRCKKCKKRFFDYLINDDKSSDMEVVMSGISLKCERYDRVMVIANIRCLMKKIFVGSEKYQMN